MRKFLSIFALTAGMLLSVSAVNAAPTTGMQKVGPKKVISAVSDLAGEYVMHLHNYSFSARKYYAKDPFYGGHGITFAAGTGDTILISNFVGGPNDIKAVVDLSAKTIIVPLQIVYSGSEGNCNLYQVKGNNQKPVTFTFDDEGNISTSTGYLFLKTTDGARVSDYMEVSFEPANAYIEAYSAKDKETKTWPVVALQDEQTHGLSIVNFGNGEIADTMVYNTDGTWTVGLTAVVDGDATYGDYKPCAATVEDGSYTLLSDSAIVANGYSLTEIVWGGWVLYSAASADANATGYDLDYFSYGRLVLPDGMYTDVKDLSADVATREVSGVTYFNVAGVESAQPFAGVNIMVTTYTDGSKTATKILK